MVTRRQKARKKFKVASAKRRAERSTGFESTTIKRPDDMQFFKLEKSGTKTIDILPFEMSADGKYADAGELYFEKTFWAHRNVGPEKKYYLCLSKNFNKKCPICEYRAQLMKDPDADEQTVKSLAPSERQLFYVIDRDAEDKGVQIWEISHFFFGDALDTALKSQDEDETPFYDPESGSSLKLQVKTNSYAGFTSYKVARVDFKPRKEELDSDLFKDLPDPADLLVEVPYAELKKEFLQMEEEDSKSKKKRKPKDEPEEDEEDEVEDTDDEEEDQEDSEEEDEEEEEKPKKSKSKKPLTAKSKGIRIGSKVEHEDFGECEVVWISGDETSLTLTDDDEEEHKAVGVDEVKLVEEDSDETDEDDEEDDIDGDTDDSEDDESDDESDDDDESEEEDDEDEELEDEPKRKKKPVKKARR